ncbi:MAG: class I SAM-dependent methyltransferase [Candidatus Woesearchaeota archaeon]
MDQKDWERTAESYHDEVVSPFFGDVENPLLDELSNVENKEHKSVAEFGCGLFYLCDDLSKQFKQVHASDFCQTFVDKARERSKNYANVTLKKEDMRKLKYKNKFDVIISVNSLIMPYNADIKKSLENIHNSIRKKGSFFLIVPSMESVLYHGMLLLDYKLNENCSEKKNGKEELKDVELRKIEGIARSSAKRKFELKNYDLFLGHYKSDKEVQKFYYKHEIEYLLRKSGFRDIRFKKVKYPWGKDISDYEDFPDEEPMWDWAISAKK